jgi:hypothetical protein
MGGELPGNKLLFGDHSSMEMTTAWLEASWNRWGSLLSLSAVLRGKDKGLTWSPRISPCSLPPWLRFTSELDSLALSVAVPLTRRKGRSKSCVNWCWSGLSRSRDVQSTFWPHSQVPWGSDAGKIWVKFPAQLFTSLWPQILIYVQQIKKVLFLLLLLS